MEMVTSPSFNPDLPPVPAYQVDTDVETERGNRHGSCSKCQEFGGGDEDYRKGTEVKSNKNQSVCPCCQRRNAHSDSNRSRSDLVNGNISHDMNEARSNYNSRHTREEFVHLQQPQSPPVYLRKYKYFPGKNNFYCNGRIMTAPKQRFCLLSFGLILVTFGLFIAFDGPFLAERVTLAIPIIGSVLFLLVIVNMVRTSWSDPGILPRASQQEHEFIERSYGGNSTTVRPPPRTKDIIVNGQTVKSKYCFTCKMFRPPRASHCGVCDNCVERFDHHCPFLGNCIGKRNYRSFYIFVISLSLLAVFVLSCSIAHLALLSRQNGDFLSALKESPTSAVVILISFFGMWTVIGLAGFHTYLIAMEQTTNEDIKGLFGRGNAKNPYSRGNFCLNCCFVLCGPHHPSLIDPRGTANSDFLASLPKKNSSPSTTAATPALFSYPTTVRAPASSSRAGNPPFQITTLETNPTTQAQVQSTSSMPVVTAMSVTSPRLNGQALITGSSKLQKAGTFPDSSVTEFTVSDSNAHHIPIETVPTIIHQPRGSASVKSIHSKGNEETTSAATGINNLPVSLSMVQLDFSSNSTAKHFNNFPALPRYHNKGEIVVSLDNNPPVDEDASTLENLTMINSPLHLDTIM